MTFRYNYSLLIDDAMRSVIKNILQQIQQYGLTDDHHFFITFDCNHESVKISSKLKAEYPIDLSIVLQHQFENLYIDDNGFSVTLRFQGLKENIYIPYKAIKAFSDPSVHFVLDFTNEEDLESILEERESDKEDNRKVDDVEDDENIIDISELIKKRTNGN